MRNCFIQNLLLAACSLAPTGCLFAQKVFPETARFTAPISRRDLVEKATKQISASHQIKSGSVTYIAGESIILDAGFSVMYGASFSALIAPVEQPSQNVVDNNQDLGKDEFDVTVYPNPFSDDTQIEYWLAESSKVSLIVYDNRGILVSRLLDNESQSGGRHKITFNSKDLTSGLYNCVLSTSSKRKVHKVFKK